MLGSIWNFVKRHRRKIIFTGVVVGGTALAWNYAKKKMTDYQEKETADLLAAARRQHHFDSNQRTGNMTVMSLLPTLREILMRELDSEKLTAQLKSNPDNKIEIWEDLKTISFTRTITAVYSCCILIVVLRVQLNIIGGYMYVDSLLNRNGTSAGATFASPEVQGKYLDMMKYIMNDGILELIASVHSVVKDVLGSVNLKQKVSLLELQDMINRIRKKLEYRQTNGYHDAPTTSLCKYMVPPDTELPEARSMTKDEITLGKLMEETRDMLESSDFHSVLTTCLDTGFTRLIDRTADYFKPNETEPFSNPNDNTMPLAKVIPIMNGMIHTIFADSPNPFVQELLRKEQVKDFAANVYEAFSQLEHHNQR